MRQQSLIPQNAMTSSPSNSTGPVPKSGPNLLKLDTVGISMNSSNFFEVLYIGKIKVSHKKVPDTFIDDALVKFRDFQHDRSVGFQQSIPDENKTTNTISVSQSLQKLSGNLLDDTVSNHQIAKSQSVQGFDNLLSNKFSPIDDNNRTMVLQIGRFDLRLISLDRKSVLLHKLHRDVISCIQGVQNNDHFGFVCREINATTSFVAYILKCESESVTSEVVTALSQAFTNRESIQNVMSCEHCPMVWFHRLCLDIETFNDRKTLTAILKRIETLDSTEQEQILAKYRTTEFESVSAQNEFLMMLLRAHCEMKQNRHVHDSLENRSEFLNHYLGGGNTIFMKAKKSLSNSFDVLLKRKGSRDDGISGPIVTASQSKDLTLALNQNTTQSNHIKNNGSDKLKSPMMDIFLKVGSSSKSVVLHEDELHTLEGPESWRQAIFKSVQKRPKTNAAEKRSQLIRSKSRNELRQLWKQSIDRVISLIRIEKENTRIRVKQEESVLRRIKLEYDDLSVKINDFLEIWELMSNKNNTLSKKIDTELLAKAIRHGVPKINRGDVWSYLSQQYESNMPPFDHKLKFPNYNQKYDSLSKQLTAHQHAILIDLARTFPNHSYFSAAFGPGQLALFNLLKAYSLLDPEVGYCQGLSFIAGVLLLHVEEPKAFALMKHVMFRRDMRKQYLPDMEALQIQLYQLTRLLRDRLPSVHSLFDSCEVHPSLYAAPWMLTIFASQFPLGFVTRVFDLIFLEGRNVIFKVSLALLDQHKDQLLQCQNFEQIMNYLKDTLPLSLDQKSLQEIIKRVLQMDIRKQLDEYRVEYFVLKEEMVAVQPKIEALTRLEKHNELLLKENQSINAQLEIALSNNQRLEKSLSMQQSMLNRHDIDYRNLEMNFNTLSSFLNELLEKKILNHSVLNDMVNQILTQSDKTRPNSHYLVKSMSYNKIPMPSSATNILTRRNSLLSDSDSDVKIDRLAKHLIRAPLPTHSCPIRVIDDDLVYEKNEKKFFSNSHNSILLQQHGKEDAAKISKSVSLPINSSLRTSTIIVEEEKNDSDSGISTPKTTESSSPNGLNALSTHPLSGSDVNFTYTGTVQLKKLPYSPESLINKSAD